MDLLAHPEAERAIIGGLMQWPQQLPAVAQLLEPGDFAEPRHRLLYIALRTMLAERPDAQPMLELPQMLARQKTAGDAGGLGYVLGLPDHVSSGTNLEHYARLVIEHAMRRRILAVATEACEASRSAPDPQALAASLASRLLALQGQVSADQHMLLDAVAERVLELGVEAEGGGTRAMPTGWTQLDGLLGGGLRAPRCYVIGARPAIGKTTVLIELLLRLAAGGAKVGFFSLEMTRHAIADKVLACKAGVPGDCIEQPEHMTQSQWDRLVGVVDHTADFALDDRSGLTLAQMEAQATLWSQTRGLDVLAVDYLQLARMAACWGSNKAAGMGEIMTGLRDLGKTLGCATVILSQLNRNVEKRDDKRPMVSDLRETGQIEQDADTIMLLYRDALYAQPGEGDTTTVDGVEMDTIELLVRKNRKGRTGVAFLGFDGAHSRVCDPWADGNDKLEAL